MCQTVWEIVFNNITLISFLYDKYAHADIPAAFPLLPELVLFILYSCFCFLFVFYFFKQGFPLFVEPFFNPPPNNSFFMTKHNLDRIPVCEQYFID